MLAPQPHGMAAQAVIEYAPTARPAVANSTVIFTEVFSTYKPLNKSLGNVLYDGIHGLWPVSSVSVWLLGIGLTCCYCS